MFDSQVFPITHRLYEESIDQNGDQYYEERHQQHIAAVWKKNERYKIIPHISVTKASRNDILAYFKVTKIDENAASFLCLVDLEKLIRSSSAAHLIDWKFLV